MSAVSTLSRRSFLKRTAGVLAASSFLGADCQWQGARPNILFILVDDLGWNDISFNGATDIRTPNIDRIFSEGYPLRNYYSYCVCTPSRVGILTGRYHWNVGIDRNINQADGLSTHTTTSIAEMLALGGYAHRGYFGKWHLGMGSVYPEYHPMNHGFTEFAGFHEGSTDFFTHWSTGYPMGWHHAWSKGFKEFKEPGHCTDLITGHTRNFIRQHTGAQPWFCFASYNTPHQPKQALPQDLAEYAGTPERYPAEQIYGNWISDRQGYGGNNRHTHAAMMAGLDRGVGEILAELESLGVLDSTLIAFVTDNGGHIPTGGDNYPFIGQKTNLYEGGIHCVAAFRWPNAGLPAYTTEITATTAYVDWLPTFCDVAGVSVAGLPLDGKPFYNSHRSKNRDLYFYERRLGTAPAIVYMGAVVAPTWKLIAQHHSKLTTEQYRFVRLFRRDASGRVDESVDVAGLYPQVVQDLRSRLSANTPYPVDL